MGNIFTGDSVTQALSNFEDDACGLDLPALGVVSTVFDNAEARARMLVLFMSLANIDSAKRNNIHTNSSAVHKSLREQFPVWEARETGLVPTNEQQSEKEPDQNSSDYTHQCQTTGQVFNPETQLDEIAITLMSRHKNTPTFPMLGPELVRQIGGDIKRLIATNPYYFIQTQQVNQAVKTVLTKHAPPLETYSSAKYALFCAKLRWDDNRIFIQGLNLGNNIVLAFEPNAERPRILCNSNEKHFEHGLALNDNLYAFNATLAPGTELLAMSQQQYNLLSPHLDATKNFLEVIKRSPNNPRLFKLPTEKRTLDIENGVDDVMAAILVKRQLHETLSAYLHKGFSLFHSRDMTVNRILDLDCSNPLQYIYQLRLELGAIDNKKSRVAIALQSAIDQAIQYNPASFDLTQVTTEEQSPESLEGFKRSLQLSLLKYVNGVETSFTYKLLRLIKSPQNCHSSSKIAKIASGRFLVEEISHIQNEDDLKAFTDKIGSLYEQWNEDDDFKKHLEILAHTCKAHGSSVYPDAFTNNYILS